MQIQKKCRVARPKLAVQPGDAAHAQLSSRKVTGGTATPTPVRPPPQEPHLELSEPVCSWDIKSGLKNIGFMAYVPPRYTPELFAKLGGFRAELESLIDDPAQLRTFQLGGSKEREQCVSAASLGDGCGQFPRVDLATTVSTAAR